MWPAISLVTGIAVLLAISLYSVMNPTLGFNLGALPDGNERVTWIMPAAPAWDFGLRAGDVVRPISVPKDSNAFYAFQVVSGSLAPGTLLVKLQWSRGIDAVLFALGLEFAGAALLVLIKAPNRNDARRFVIFATACAIGLVVAPASQAGHPWALFVEVCALTLFSAAFANFFLTTPVPRWNRWRMMLIGCPFVILPIYTLVVSSGFQDFYPIQQRIVYLYTAIALLTGVVALVQPFITRAPIRERQLWPVAASSSAAIALFALLGLLPYAVAGYYAPRTEELVLCWGIVPIGFVWAMLRRRVMGVSLGSLANLRLVFETIGDPIFLIDSNGIVVEASDAGWALLRISDTDRPKTNFDLLAQRFEDRGSNPAPQQPTVFQRVLKREHVRDEKTTVISPEGNPIHMSVEGRPLIEEDGTVGLAVISYRDITSMVESQKLKDEQLAMLAHDMRNPLATMTMQAGVLTRYLSREASPQLQEGVERLARNARTVNLLLNDLLEVTRLEAGLINPRIVPINTLELLEEIVARQGETSPNCQISLEMAADLPSIHGDGDLLDRVLGNILVNALHYAGHDRPVEVRASVEDADLHIRISDHGPGIPEEELPDIFERSYRGQASKGKPGTGLGLYIARLIVDLHGGRIWAENRKSGGATFHITLPARV